MFMIFIKLHPIFLVNDIFEYDVSTRNRYCYSIIFNMVEMSLKNLCDFHYFCNTKF